MTVTQYIHKGVINLMWLIPPCPSLSTGECVISCTPHPSLRIIFPVPFLPYNCTWWIGEIFFPLPCEPYLPDRLFLIISFLQSKKNQEGADRITPCNNPGIFPDNTLAMYIYLYTNHIIGHGYFLWLIPV